jgi:[ribosomal protein S18]-alanine N-acetyltransferase
MSFVSRLVERRSPSSPADVVIIEPMRRRHLRSILAIEHQVYPKPWTIGVFHTELDNVRAGARHYVVARIGQDVVGYGGLLYALDEAHVTNIAVDPARHRTKIGSRVLLALAREALASGKQHLSLEVRLSNTAAQDLYRRFGFAPAGIRKNYYENVEDAIVMWCHDIDAPAYRERLLELEAAL